MLIGRHESSTLDQGKALPQQWTESFVAVLTQNYGEQSDKDESFFDVFGQIYDEEIVVVTSYVHQTDYSVAPISIFLSFDTPKDSNAMSEALKELVDLVGHILEDIFQTKDWNDYTLTWTPNQFKNHTFHYKITRENISLSLQAEEILKKEGPV